MIAKLKNAWRTLRGHFWGSLAMDVALIVTAFMLVSMWQTRDLPDDDYTPPLELAWLDDMRADTVLVPGKVGVIYFFAPWCFYCRKSIDNLDELVASDKLAWARLVALEYGDLDEIREFIKETGVDLPVLLGGPQTSNDWSIRGFPSRSVGYSTRIGLQTRVWMTQE